jgi:predicted  nucleic acid-binding Zn-ribbon protein
MSLTTLFEKIAGKQKQREKARIDDFRALVRSIGTGQEPDADQVERVLSDADKSLDDLRAAVELYQKRFAMRTLVNSMPKIEAERKELERQVTQADETLEAAERKHEETTAPLTGRLEMLRQAMQEAERSRQQLVETCPDEGLRTHLADLQRRHAETHDRSFKLRQTINDCRTWAKSDQAEAAHATSSPRKEQELRERAERREAKAAECEKELAEVLKQLAGLEKQMQAARDAMLEP